MPRLMVTLPPATAEALRDLAHTERRDPRDQIAIFVEQALASRRRGPTDNVPTSLQTANR